MNSGINTGSKDSKSDLCQDDYKTATVLKERVKKTTDRDKNRFRFPSQKYGNFTVTKASINQYTGSNTCESHERSCNIRGEE